MSRGAARAVVLFASIARAAGVCGVGGVVGAATFVATPAWAQSPSGASPTAPQDNPSLGASYPVTPQRRNGIVLGATLGVGVVGASGYPNNATRIGDPAYYGASGWMIGSQQSLLIMGALADFVNFGFWLGGASAQNGDWKSKQTAGGVRVEAFPLFLLLPLYPRLRDLGVLAHFGLAGATLDAAHGSYAGADGTQSLVGLGAFYEWRFADLLGGHFALGPSLEYDAMFSPAIERHGLVASARLVWYGGP